MLARTCPRCGRDMGEGDTCPHCGTKVLFHAWSRSGFSPQRMALIGFGLMILLSIAFHLVPIYYRARDDGHFILCQSNEKKIAAALEKYSDDHGGKVPPALKDLTPKYLSALPTCLSVGGDTYTSSYACSKNRQNFTLSCDGINHFSMVEKGGYPMYTSREGLITGR